MLIDCIQRSLIAIIDMQRYNVAMFNDIAIIAMYDVNVYDIASMLQSTLRCYHHVNGMSKNGQKTVR